MSKAPPSRPTGGGVLTIRDAREEADKNDPWLRGVLAAESRVHGRAWDNCLKTATARARTAAMRDGQRISHTTAAKLGASVGLSAAAIRRGTVTLLEHGLLTEVIPRTENLPATYALTVPEHIAHIRDWQPIRHNVPSIELTVEQKELEQALWLFLNFGHSERGRDFPGHVFVLHGFAGTGKTTATVSILAQMAGIDFDRILFLTYTNKAASVLRELGVNATTIKRALYTPGGTDPDTGETKFLKNYANDLGCYDLVVVDEASMVPESDALWLESQASKVLAIGDPAQLNPVKARPYWTSPDKRPDMMLSDVQRAENAALRNLGISMRENSLTLADIQDPQFRASPHGSVPATAYNMVLVTTNAERHVVNRAVRGGGPPMAGDKIMVLENVNMATPGQWNAYYNGQILTVDEVLETAKQKGRGRKRGFSYYWIKATERVGETSRTRYLHILDDFLLSDPTWAPGSWEEVERGATLYGTGEPVLRATYANAITIHKAQGSGYETALLIDPGHSRGDEAVSLAYVGVTRARRELHIAHLAQVEGVEE